MIKKLLFFFILAFSFHHLAAQENEQGVFDPITDDITKKIPPLEALIDSAIANSPYLKFRDAQIVINHYKYLNDRSQLLRDIGFSIEARFGKYDNYSENNTTGVPIYTGSARNEWRYGAGAYIKIPLYDLTNRKTTINLAKKEVEQAINYRNTLAYEIRRDIIVMYNELILKQRLLKIASDNMITAELQMQLAEKQFMSGQLPLGELSRMTDLHARAKMSYEENKIAFLNAYKLLEILVGVTFNLMNSIQ
ncbi:MAG: TolC family protein [Bacteroidales bacterium]|jgi:outer membrane protein TolC|nr:TolC family protein [Bacteroidales bacterium]